MSVADTESNSPSPVEDQTEQPKGLSQSLGNWAFEHKDTFNSTAGSLAFRNFTRSLVAIVPYVLVNVAVQHAFKHTVNAGKSAGKLLTPVLKHPIIQSTAAIAFSFTTFRSTVKVWNDNYDRIFKAKSKEEATDAVSHLAGNIVKDYVKILPTEFAATGISSITLGAIRTGLKNVEPPGSQKAAYALEKDFAHNPNIRKEFPGGMEQFKGQFGNDYFANAMGYATFFEASDRLYSMFTKSHSNGVYHKGTLPAHPDAPEPERHFNKDTPTRLLFRNVASVFAAALPFIATQRYANMKTGNYNNKKNSYMKDVGIGMVSWEPSFAVFTTGMEAWQKSYDGLFKELNQKYDAESQDPAKSR